MKKGRALLKSYFVKNAIPTEENFSDFIESGLNQAEDGIEKKEGSPVSIQAEGDASGLQNTLFFYKRLGDPNPSWRFSQNPRLDMNNATTNKPGLNISDATGASRLFIKNDDGRIGVGTIDPIAQLHIKQGNLIVENGNVGIGTGTSEPQAKLHVKGAIHAGTSDIYFTDNNHTYTGYGNTAGYAAIENCKVHNALMLLGRTTSDKGRVVRLWDYLQVNGTFNVTGAMQPSAGNSAATGIQFPANPGGGGGDEAWIRYYSRSGEACTLEIGINNDADDHIALMPSGCVGIGTTDPKAKLHVNGAIHAGTSDIYFTDAEHNHTGYGNATGYAAIENCKNYGALLILGRTSTDGRVIQMWDHVEVHGDLKITHAGTVKITQEGYIGIGTETPGAPLQITVSKNVEYGPYAYLTLTGGNYNSNKYPRTTIPVSIMTSGRIVCPEFDANSDARIKKDIMRSNPVADLETINRLRITDFCYKDEVSFGDRPKKGLIAQEVENVFPDAVSTHPDFIPDIFSLPETVLSGDGFLSVTMKDDHGLETDDTVRLIGPAGPKEVNVVKTDNKTFTVQDWTEETERIFVYGKKVADFRTLDYNSVCSLGISAIQELSRQLQQLKEEVTGLKEKALA